MTTAPQVGAAAQPFHTANQVPISHLSPLSTDPSGPSYVLAQVALVWPYSSSTGTLALLLADTDFRRRKSKGQVKVVFRHGCAREVARTRVGIGDVVKLALAGCEWTETGDAVSTPGKKIDWDIEYRRRVILQVLRDGQDLSTVDFTSSEAEDAVINGPLAVLNDTYSTRPSLNGVVHQQPSTIHVPYLTPQKPFRSVSAGTFTGSALDPWTEDDGYVRGQGRKRTKFARSSDAWSLLDSEEAEEGPARTNGYQEYDDDGLDVSSEPDAPVGQDSSVKETLTHTPVREDVQRLGKEDGAASLPERSGHPQSPPVAQSVVMGPPSTPFSALRLQPMSNQRDAQASPLSDSATTPRLLPIPSPGLPLVSPLLQRSGVEVGYFPPFDATSSQLDASSNAAADTLEDDKSTPEADSEGPRSDDSVMVIEHAATDDANILQSETNFESAQLPPLTPLESRFDEDRLPKEQQLPTNNARQPSSDPQIVEIEDDDLYGAPLDIPAANSLTVTPPLVELTRSPVDVMEQFLEISPIATAEYTTGSKWAGAEQASPTTPSEKLPKSTSHLRHDDIQIPVIQRQTSITYPESQSPFRQNRDQQTSSNSSSRRSSAHRAQATLLDGPLDEQAPFHDYMNHLAQLAASTDPEQQAVGDVNAAHDDNLDSLQTATDLPAAVTTVEKTLQFESTGGAAEIVIQEAVETGVIDSRAETVGPQSPQLVTVQNKVAAHHQLGPQQNQIPQTNLPTPDQSQAQRPSPEYDADASEQVLELTKAALLSPQATQEETKQAIDVEILETEEETRVIQHTDEGSAQNLDGASQMPEEFAEPSPVLPATEPTGEGAQVDLREESPVAVSAEPTLSTKMPGLESDSTSRRRTSQRLSARKSIMANNISSPYFTSNKATRAASSSPTRKENIRFATPDRISIPSSPAQEKTQAPVQSGTNLEPERSHVDIQPVSANFLSKRPVSRRHTGTTTPLAYYAHLSSLHEHFGQTVDTLAVCAVSSSPPERSKSGPKDFHTALHIADTSLSSEDHTTVTVQVFRHAKEALPKANEGDVVILRNFKVQTAKRKIMLLSTETSSWAVFEAKSDSTMSWSDVVISGPPLEYGPAETSRVKLLFSWWNKSGKQQFFPDTSTQNAEENRTSSPELGTKSPKLKATPSPNLRKQAPSQRRVANMTDNFNNEDAVENFYASFGTGEDSSMVEDGVDGNTENIGSFTDAAGHDINMTDNIANESDTRTILTRSSTRRKANWTDHVGNTDDQDAPMPSQELGQSPPPLRDATNGHNRRQSTVSLAASESGRAVTPRRSERQKQRQAKTPSVVHELRDGTRYVDGEARRDDSVVHELRDGVTYVDE